MGMGWESGWMELEGEGNDIRCRRGEGDMLTFESFDYSKGVVSLVVLYQRGWSRLVQGLAWPGTVWHISGHRRHCRHFMALPSFNDHCRAMTIIQETAASALVHGKMIWGQASCSFHFIHCSLRRPMREAIMLYKSVPS